MIDVYELVTKRIIEELEKGHIPWKKPWVARGGAISHETGRGYSLLNQLMLGKPGEYITFNQAKKEGGHVKEGAKAKHVVFWKFLKTKDEITGEEKKIPLLKYYSVFDIEDCEGIKPKYINNDLGYTIGANDTAENIIDEYTTREHIGLQYVEGDRAYYTPSRDTVTLPLRDQFKAIAEFYSTAFHELTHSTGHKNRLNRINDKSVFGSEEYSKEELVAEIGASTLTNYCGLETDSSFKNTAAYIENWLSALQNDKKLIVTAAGKAEKAINLILNINPEESEVLS